VKRFLTLMIVAISLALVGPGLAQTAPGAGGAEPRTPVQIRRTMRSAASAMMMLIQLYDPATVTTVKGGVVSLGTLPPKTKAKGAMRSAVLKTEQGNISVFLAPDWYLAEQQVSLKVGDEVEVTGSKITMGKEPSIIVKDLKVGGKNIALRDAGGTPIWLGPAPAATPATPAK
jgi:hypothetical protein